MIKLLTKEIIVPQPSNRYLFILAPMLSFGVALLGWAVIPFDQNVVLANVNAGVLAYVFAISSMGVYGIMICGMGLQLQVRPVRFAARRGTIHFPTEICMGFALIGVMMAAGSLNFQTIVEAQAGGFWHWYWLPLFPLFIVYWVSGIAADEPFAV